MFIVVKKASTGELVVFGDGITRPGIRLRLILSSDREVPDYHLVPRSKKVIQRISCTTCYETNRPYPASECRNCWQSWSQDTNADNTGKNVRDRDDQSVTATDQSNDPADLKLTADIRKIVVGDDSLSMMAKNVKIVTVGGVVTLRGPVETDKEKSTIKSHAKQAGAKKHQRTRNQKIVNTEQQILLCLNLL